MTTEEREGASVNPVEPECERCGDFGTLRAVNERRLCARCVDRLPEAIRGEPSFTNFLAGVSWTLARGAPQAIPVALGFATLTSLLPWALSMQGVGPLSFIAALTKPAVQLILLAIFGAVLHDDPVSIRSATAKSGGSYSSALITDLYCGLVIFCAALAFLVPGLVFATRYSLTTAVVLHEGTGGGEALARSTRYVHGIGWPLFAAMCAVYLPPVALNAATAAACSYYFQAELLAGDVPAVLPAVDIIASSVTWLCGTALVAVVYANRRFHVHDAIDDAPAPYPASSARATPAP